MIVIHTKQASYPHPIFLKKRPGNGGILNKKKPRKLCEARQTSALDLSK
jgi:hypothetical protein